MPLERQMDFLIIGAAKCATTWLQMSLMETQEIFMPDPELHYFSREYERGPDWYSSYFEAAGGAQLVGEKSNSYMTAPKAAERIKRDCPSVRLIVQMRDPAQRAYSDYCMLFRRGEVNDDIYAHLDPDRAADQRFLNDGLYAFHLRRFYDLFPADHVLLLAYEDVRTAAQEQLAKVSGHIGFAGTLNPPLQTRVKDKEIPLVPRGLRRVLGPVRPLLDPVRNTWPMQAVRNAVARKVEYPPLPADLSRKMAEFFAKDADELNGYMPGISRQWTSLQEFVKTDEPAVRSGSPDPSVA